MGIAPYPSRVNARTTHIPAPPGPPPVVPRAELGRDGGASPMQFRPPELHTHTRADIDHHNISGVDVLSLCPVTLVTVERWFQVI